MLAGPMPLTVTRMLELDAMHRSGDRLDARLRCLVRWAAADANGCDYMKAVANADLRRARNAETNIEEILSQPEKLPAFDRAAVSFARRMMLEAHAVTDAEVKQLIDLGGEERLVALVTLLAHASFQDRVIMALNAPAEAADGIPPLAVHFTRISAKAGPSRKSPLGAKPPLPELPKLDITKDWLDLQQGLNKQRERPGRIHMPSREEVIKRLGPDHPSAWQAGIRWSRVCYGYQPELTEAWFDTTGVFRQESSLDPLFSNSIFWVVTQSLKCFY
jgi:alkylhydroperoxidase family enzyme